MAGLLPQLKPFVGMLWAALGSKGTGEGEIWRRQVEVPLRWLSHLFGSTCSFASWRKFARPLIQVVIATDASPFGGGALLWILPSGASITLELLLQRVPLGWAARTWTPEDCHAAGAVIGEASSQARWEAFALVSAIHLWSGQVLAADGDTTMVTDALGVLCGAATLRNRDRAINTLLMDLALLLAPSGRCVEGLHIWSEENTEADALSRLCQGAVVPQRLSAIPRTAWPEAAWRKVRVR